MTKPEENTWWDRLCVRIGFTWDMEDPSPAPPAALQSTPPASPTQSIYAREARLQNLKFDLAEVSGVLLAELSYDHEISLALERGDAVIVEVAVGTKVVTIHSLPVEDLGTFASLAAWAAFECSGRDVAFDSTFYRIDLEPVESARAFLAGCNSQAAIWLSGSVIVCPEPVVEDDDDGEKSDGGGASGAPDVGRKREDDCGGPEAAPGPIRPRPPRGR